MLRRTLLSRVHLFTALVPNVTVQGPHFISEEQAAVAAAALDERKDFMDVEKLVQCVNLLSNVANMHDRGTLTKKLSDCGDSLRAQLYRKTMNDARHRLQIHEAIMATGFYQRAISTTQLDGEGVRFVLNHYNFDVRRDTVITKKVHETLLEDKTTTPESDQLLHDLLLLERHLSGKHRFSIAGGRRWFTLGMALSEIKTEVEAQRLLDLEVIKQDGNFALAEKSSEKLWKTITITPQEEEFTSFGGAAGIFKDATESDTVFELRVQKPIPPLDYWEQLREKLLQYWVIWFALWASFFMVDEEVLTLVALIFLKHKQTQILEEEAEKSGGKVYVASATGRANA